MPEEASNKANYWHVCKLEGETELIHVYVILSISQSSMVSVTPLGEKTRVYYPVLDIFIFIFSIFTLTLTWSP